MSDLLPDVLPATGGAGLSPADADRLRRGKRKLPPGTPKGPPNQGRRFGDRTAAEWAEAVRDEFIARLDKQFAAPGAALKPVLAAVQAADALAAAVDVGDVDGVRVAAAALRDIRAAIPSGMSAVCLMQQVQAALFPEAFADDPDPGLAARKAEAAAAKAGEPPPKPEDADRAETVRRKRADRLAAAGAAYYTELAPAAGGLVGPGGGCRASARGRAAFAGRRRAG